MVDWFLQGHELYYHKLEFWHLFPFYFFAVQGDNTIKIWKLCMNLKQTKNCNLTLMLPGGIVATFPTFFPRHSKMQKQVIYGT